MRDDRFAKAQTDPNPRAMTQHHEPTAGELHRSIGYVEAKVDRLLRELDGEGDRLGVRAATIALRKTISDLDTDLGAQRREIFERLSEVKTELLERITGLERALRVPAWHRWIYLLCAIAGAGSLLAVTMRVGE